MRVIAVLFAIILLNSGLLMVGSTVPPYLFLRRAPEEPERFEKEGQYCTQISDIMVDGDYLYVLSDFRNVPNCCRLNREYSHSFVFEYKPNGRNTLERTGERAYVMHRSNSLYSIAAGEITDYIDCKEAPSGENAPTAGRKQW